MASSTRRSLRYSSCLTGLALPALLLLLALALAKGEESAAESASTPAAASRASGAAATQSDGSGGGLGSLLRRLMLDLFAWLGSLFGLRGSEVDYAPDYPAREDDVGGEDYGERGGHGRHPPRGGQRSTSTANPQDVEHIPPDGIDESGLTRGDSAGRRRPEFSDSAEDAVTRRAGRGRGGADLNASPEGGNGDASVEQFEGGGRAGGVEELQGTSATSREDLAGERERPAPLRVAP